MWNKEKNRVVYGAIGLLVVLNLFAWIVLQGLIASDYLEVVYFDVGQGDSAFIETSDGFQILIDGGPDLTVLEKLGQEMPFYDRTIDLIILTHPDHDHIYGLLEVLKRYEIKNILWTGVVKNTAEWKEWQRLIKEEEANIIIAKVGQKIHDREDLVIDVLYPFENIENQEFKNLNDTSVVISLTYGEVDFLFAGDISCKIEKQIEANTDVLKVAHHGSKTSSCSEFLEKTSPEVAVISVGENNWNHPSPETLANLSKFGIKTLITRELGDIKIVSDGNFFNIKN